VAAGESVSWTTGEVVRDGYTFGRGSLLVAASNRASPIVESIARTLGLRAAGLAGRPEVSTQPVGAGRVGLYKPWMDVADEGWLLEQHESRFQTIADSDVRAGRLRQRFDAIVLPSASPQQLLHGNPANTLPPMYVGGLGTEGIAALRSFVDSGGTLVCLDQTC